MMLIKILHLNVRKFLFELLMLALLVSPILFRRAGWMTILMVNMHMITWCSHCPRYFWRYTLIDAPHYESKHLFMSIWQFYHIKFNQSYTHGLQQIYVVLPWIFYHYCMNKCLFTGNFAHKHDHLVLTIVSKRT